MNPKLRLVSSKASVTPAFGPAICCTEFSQPLAQSWDCTAVYVRMPKLVKPFCFARYDDHAFGQSKQRLEPFSPKRFGPWFHSGLMFQPNAGTLLSTRYLAPAKVMVETGSTANTLSCSTSARTWSLLRDACPLSSRLATNFSWRLNTPPCALTWSK